MHLDELRNYCLIKKGVEETMPFGNETLVFKVMSKMFLLTGIESQPVEFNVKCDPEKAIELREKYPCVLPGYHMNKQHWNTIICDGSVSRKQIQEWIDESYNLVVSSLTKKLRAELENL
ncbi:MAG: MmcQ/YjbR family DNA-binding protein [Bacteroidota bacterium]